MNLSLHEDLPLRTTAVLGDFAGKEVLPQRFGDLRRTRFPLRKLTASKWFAADHPMTITKVFVDDEETPGFAASLDNDDQGNTWTVVDLAAPAAPDAKISASGIGRLDPVTGALLENPAEIAEFVLRLAGRSETFPLLRAECAKAGIVLAGSLDRAQSIRAWLDEIFYSAGAIWTIEAARLYPIDYVRGSIVPLDKWATNIKASSSLDDTADVLRIYYDLNDATGSPQQFVELTASPQRFGGITAEITLKWMRQAANAETIGKRTLGRMAGERYSVTFGTDQVQIRPCQWVRIEDHPGWPLPGDDPTLMVLSSEPDYEARQSLIVAEVIASTPTIAVTAHSVALPNTTTAAVSVRISNGVATFTIYDEHGKPMKDALVSLDGAAAKKTNEAGDVSFTTKPSNPPKKHQLAVHKFGFVDQILDIYL